MTTTPAQAYRQALVRWTDGVRRLAWLVVAASVLLSAAAAVYLAENIRINTDTGDMLSADLAFRRHSAEMDKAFPQFSDNLIVVIDGDSPDLSNDAARALAERLRRQPKLFGRVDDPAGNARRVVAAVDAARGEGVLDEDTPVFVELPAVDPAYSWLAAADEVAAAELRLKLRTGGLDPDAFPTPERLAAWIDAALDRELPFKCTAGLHRALPHVDADGCAHHGFLTLLAATRVAFDGGSPDDVVSTLRRDDPTDLLTLDLAGARRWFTSFGSCSIDEPLADLRELVSL